MRRPRRGPGRRLVRLLVLVAGAAALLLGPAVPAGAHPLSTSAVLLDVGDTSVGATVELPLDELSIARDQVLTATGVLADATLVDLRAYVEAHLSASDASGRAWSTVVSGGRVEPVDGVDNLVLDATLTPASGPVGDFVLHDDVIVDRLVSHRVFVSGRYGRSGAYTTLAMLAWQTPSVPVASAAPAGTATSSVAPPAQGFVPAVRLGVHHIAGGSDHLLFLIMLLLPAPLVAVGRCWRPRTAQEGPGVGRVTRRVVHVVTAFAVGHSCTLLLGALGWVHLPSRLVECGIALSVLVSAVHAFRPLVRRGEVLVAGGFGLLHGLAFAAVLGSLDLGRTSLVTTLLGFNLGIELTQLLVVALVVPSLLLLSRTPAYTALRLGVAGAGAVLAGGWFAERAGLVDADPFEPVGNLLVDHPLALAGALAALALALTAVQRSTSATALVRVLETVLPQPVAPVVATVVYGVRAAALARAGLAERERARRDLPRTTGPTQATPPAGGPTTGQGSTWSWVTSSASGSSSEPGCGRVRGRSPSLRQQSKGAS